MLIPDSYYMRGSPKEIYFSRQKVSPANRREVPDGKKDALEAKCAECIYKKIKDIFFSFRCVRFSVDIYRATEAETV